MPENKSKRNLIPEIKKDLKSFMLEEKGGASKQTLISLGALLAGIEIVGVLSKVVTGAQISAIHDHCDPGHNSHGSGCGTAHSSADGVPESHCSASSHASCGWSHRSSPNPSHKNNLILNYG